MELVKSNTQDRDRGEDGKLTVWRTHEPLDDMVFELAANLTARGERLIVLDSTGSFDPSRVSRAAASVATNLHVLRATPGSELHATLWSSLQSVQERTQAKRVLLVGVLDHLYSRGIVTREAARALGRLKLVLRALTQSGLDVTVVCESGRSELGSRLYLVSSLCAAAQDVRYWPSASQEDIDSASAAIA